MPELAPEAAAPPPADRRAAAVEALLARTAGDAPRAASLRASLRSGLPAIYHEYGFGLRFVAALETVLDPLLAVLDSLPAHFDPQLAPDHMVELLAAWLGVELDESAASEQRRLLVAEASELTRLRGTPEGLRRTLELAFPDVPTRVEDGGGVNLALRADDLPAPGPREFTVYCDAVIAVERLAAMDRLIAAYKPIDVRHRLRAKRGEPS